MMLKDIHSHFVYGMDDGAKTKDDMYRMLTAAVQDHIGQLYATPHITPGIEPFQTERFERHFAEAEAFCRDQAYPIRLFKGAEILYTPAISPYARHGELPMLGDTGRILVEFSPEIPRQELYRALTLLHDAGYQIIAAHIERYRCLREPFAVEQLLKSFPSLMLQVNARSITGQMPMVARLLIHHWLKAQLIDYIASDAHRLPERPYLQTAALEALNRICPADYARSLIEAD